MEGPKHTSRETIRKSETKGQSSHLAQRMLLHLVDVGTVRCAVQTVLLRRRVRVQATPASAAVATAGGIEQRETGDGRSRCERRGRRRERHGGLLLRGAIKQR